MCKVDCLGLSGPTFSTRYKSVAQQSADKYLLNPSVLLAHAALESGMGHSCLAQRANNFFGMTAFDRHAGHWGGASYSFAGSNKRFRLYMSANESFLDFASYLRRAYPKACNRSHFPDEYVKALPYDARISEINQDDYAVYQKTLYEMICLMQTQLYRMQFLC